MKSSNIGGQAVLEGIMMKHNEEYAVAVRKPDGEISVKKEKYHSIVKWKVLTTTPFIRGVFNFIDSMVIGIKTLTYSASFYEEEEEKEEVLTEEAVKKKEKKEKLLMGATVAFSVVAAVAIFMVLPYFLTSFLKGLIPSYQVRTVIEGLVRIGIFVLYVLLISRMEDIQRTFMYHGAEHKCINCIEHGARLIPENVKNSSRLHKRCGTSFLFIVMFISVLFFIFIRIDNTALQLVVRLLLVPLIAGVSYEVIRWAGKNENPVVEILSKPGLWLQKLTTREPDMDMIEVAIKAVEEVFDWEAFLLEYYKDLEEPEAEMAANEAALALTGTIKTNADKKTRSLNPEEIIQESNASSVKQNVSDYTVSEMSFAHEHLAGDESESTVHDIEFEENDDLTEDDELPEGFEIIEDDDTYDNAFRSREDILNRNDLSSNEEKNESLEREQNLNAEPTVTAAEIDEMLETSASDDNEIEEADDDNDGFEFIEEDVDDIDCADDLPIFKQRADKKR